MGRIRKDRPWEYRVVTDAMKMNVMEPFTADTIQNLFQGKRCMLSKRQIGYVLNHDHRVDPLGGGLYRWKYSADDRPIKIFEIPCKEKQPRRD
jgi:hypothetical protein